MILQRLEIWRHSLLEDIFYIEDKFDIPSPLINDEVDAKFLE